MPRCDFITTNHDVIGDDELKVGSNVATVDECIKLVNEKKVNEPSLGINGMTYMNSGSKDCYAEVKAKHIQTTTPGCSTKCQTCIFKSISKRSIL